MSLTENSEGKPDISSVSLMIEKKAIIWWLWILDSM